MDNEQINEEIRNIVENNRKKICANIREIIGILICNDRLNIVIDDYIVARDYCYTHTNRFNIPYSILYTRNVINIFGQKVADSDIGKRIHEAIQNNCMYFRFVDSRIQKVTEDYVTLNLLMIKHRVDGSRQYMTIRIEEQNRNENHIVFEEKVEMKQYIY